MQRRWMACMRPLSARRSLPVLPCREPSVRPLVSRHVFPPLRTFHSFQAPSDEAHAPLRKQLKQAAKWAKSAKAPGSSPLSNSYDTLNDWELTVGIEIHAQLNTARKLFSCTCCMSLSGQPYTNFEQLRQRHQALSPTQMLRLSTLLCLGLCLSSNQLSCSRPSEPPLC